MMSLNKPKYNTGDYVILDKVFTPIPTNDGSNYDKSHGEISVVVVKVQTTVSLGYCYQLESPEGIDLGGVMYWESDILRKALSPEELEIEYWKTWGDI
tara:strand:- start:457 stop:750 length:294 start_codon:yes stop_codon:yes gene_type:complete